MRASPFILSAAATAFLTVGCLVPSPAWSQSAADGFDPNVSGNIYAILIQADGKIVIGGDFTAVGGTDRTNLARLHVDGSVDTSFNSGASSRVRCLALQADGEIIVGANSSRWAGRRATASAGFMPTEAWTSISIPAGMPWSPPGHPDRYSTLHRGARIPGGWQCLGLSLPVGQNFYVRARGRSSGGWHNSSGGLIESVAQFYRIPPPQLVVVPDAPAGTFRFAFTNISGASFTVMATTNLASPAPDWNILGPPLPVGGGIYQFTDPGATNHARRFYELRSP